MEEMKTKQIEYTTKFLALSDLDAMVESLENPSVLPDAFIFDESPQGQEFWWDQSGKATLTTEGREALLDIIKAKRESDDE